MLVIFVLLCFPIASTPTDKMLFERDDISDLVALPAENVQASTAKTNYKASGNFLLVLNYYEQISCATRNLLLMGHVAQNLAAKLVAPFLLRSRFYGVPDLIPSTEIPGEFLPLETVFDLGKLNETLNSYSGSYLVDFENFIHYAPREIVIVDQLRGYFTEREFKLDELQLTRIYNMMKQTKIKAFDCANFVKWNHSFFNKTHLMLRRHARLFGKEEFRIIEYICILADEDVTTSDIKFLIGTEPRTIVFTEYRGCTYNTCNTLSPARTIGVTQRNRILYHSNNLKSIPPTKLIISLYNAAIKQTALQFLQRMQIGDPFVSLHIRIEKLQRIDQVFNKHTKCCLNILQKLLSELRKQYVDRVLMITDMSEFGSDSCADLNCLKYVRKFRESLSRMGLVQRSFDPLVTNSSKSSAFASLVEMHILAMGDHLIVMGAGSFKYQVITQFSKSSPSNKVYHVCTDQGNVLNEFSHMVEDCS